MKTITRYYSLPTLAAKYTHAQNVLTVAKRVERSRSIVIIKHKYMLICNHKIRVNLMRCLRNITARREIGQLNVPPISKSCANSFFERSFMYAAPTLWNNLSHDTRMLDFIQFKSRIKTELYLKYFEV